MITIIDLSRQTSDNTLLWTTIHFNLWIKTKQTAMIIIAHTMIVRGHIYKSCNCDCIICFFHIDLKTYLERCSELLFIMFVTKRSVLTMLFSHIAIYLVVVAVAIPCCCSGSPCPSRSRCWHRRRSCCCSCATRPR